jgi:hypothetical protein
MVRELSIRAPPLTLATDNCPPLVPDIQAEEKRPRRSAKVSRAGRVAADDGKDAAYFLRFPGVPVGSRAKGGGVGTKMFLELAQVQSVGNIGAWDDEEEPTTNKPEPSGSNSTGGRRSHAATLEVEQQQQHQHQHQQQQQQHQHQQHQQHQKQQHATKPRSRPHSRVSNGTPEPRNPVRQRQQMQRYSPTPHESGFVTDRQHMQWDQEDQYVQEQLLHHRLSQKITLRPDQSFRSEDEDLPGEVPEITKFEFLSRRQTTAPVDARGADFGDQKSRVDTGNGRRKNTVMNRTAKAPVQEEFEAPNLDRLKARVDTGNNRRGTAVPPRRQSRFTMQQGSKLPHAPVTARASIVVVPSAFTIM